MSIIYVLSLLILATGFYIMINSDNYFKKIIGLSIFQNSVLIFYIALGKVYKGAPPVSICDGLENCHVSFSSPLPQVLMLTAIVVGFATLAVALSLIYQIHSLYGSVLESEIDAQINI